MTSKLRCRLTTLEARAGITGKDIDEIHVTFVQPVRNSAGGGMGTQEGETIVLWRNPSGRG